MFDPKININQIINNEELFKIFQCSPQGGMRRSLTTNTLVLVADYTKGFYHDKWIGNVLHYTGMGLLGDQDINQGQNPTLNESNTNGVDLHLFEVIEQGEYTYCGRVKLVEDPYQEDQLDIASNMRKVWIFPVAPVHSKSLIKPDFYVFKDNDDYVNRGQDIDKKYNEHRKKLKESKKCAKTAITQTVEEIEAKYADILTEYSILIGKRISHINYGDGTIIKITCTDDGTVMIVVKLDKKTDGVDERKLGYDICLEKKLIRIE